jgi:rubrerythrin
MRHSIDATEFGPNVTGQKTSPSLSKAMNDVAGPAPDDVTDATPINDVRVQYIREADPLGSVPPPATVKAVGMGAAQRIEGERPSAFIDKLAERLAYERGGTRLYDALIAKFTVYAGELKDVSLQDIVEIRDDELEHAELLHDCLEQLGADPTAQTPCADLVGIATTGFLQAATDPRTTLAQTLQVTLAAELVDGASWQLLISMAEALGQKDMAGQFRAALDRENEHLDKVRTWLETLTLQSTAPTSKAKSKRKAN